MAWPAMRSALASRLSPAGLRALGEMLERGEASFAAVSPEHELRAACLTHGFPFDPIVCEFEQAVAGLEMANLQLGVARSLAAYPSDPDALAASEFSLPLWPAGVDEWNGAPLVLYLDRHGGLVCDQELERVRRAADDWPIYLERRLVEIGASARYVALATSAVGAEVARGLGASALSAASDSVTRVWSRTEPEVIIFEHSPPAAPGGVRSVVRVDTKRALVDALSSLHAADTGACLSVSGPDLEIEWANDAALYDAVPAGARRLISAPCHHAGMHQLCRLHVFLRGGELLVRVVTCWKHEIASERGT